MSIESRSRQYGKVFDHWQIKEFLGSGSGGKTAVFRLVRSDSNRGVSALKVVNLIEVRGDINNLSEFRQKEYETARDECSRNAEQEVWLMDDLRGNTNIVDYLDHTFVDWSDETGFGRDLLIRMELLKDLRSELQNGRAFSEREVLKIGSDICIALIRCHRKNILHRDIKPENIFRNKDGDYKLGDFGVSRVLDACPGAVASTGIGTYEYWPAEQMTGRYDKRVDIYSLGLVLYELCNQNRLPFAATTYVTGKEISLRLAGTPLPEPVETSPALSEVILKACAFDPEERYQSAEELLRELNRVIRSLQKTTEHKTAGMLISGVQKNTEYATVPAESSEVETPGSKYKTILASADEQKKRTAFSTEVAKRKIYATEPTEKHVPKYVTKNIATKQKSRLPLGWIALAVLGLCTIAFAAGSILADIMEKRDIDRHDTVLQTEIVPTVESDNALESNDVQNDLHEIQHLTMVVSKENFKELYDYPNLKSLDLTDSECYAEIIQYTEEHPNIAVTYSVALGGREIKNTETDAVLLPTEYKYETIRENLQYLPQLKNVKFDDIQLSAEEIRELQTQYENIKFDYSVKLFEEDYPMDQTGLDLSKISDSDVEEAVSKLGLFPKLTRVSLNNDLSLVQVAQLQDANTNAHFDYSFTLFGKQLSTADKSVLFSGQQIGNAGEPEIRKALAVMDNCERFVLDDCGIDYALLSDIRDDFRNGPKLVWRIRFGVGNRYTTMTDDTTIRAVYNVTDETSGPMQYLEDVKYLDIGHNEYLSDLSFVKNMPDLEILIASGTAVESLNGLENCEQLTWLELAYCDQLRKIDALAQCRGLKYLNISYTNVTDLSALDSLELERFVCLEPKATEKVRTDFLDAHPKSQCITVFFGYSQPYGYGWRYDDNGKTMFWYYKDVVREVFNYDAADNIQESEGHSVSLGIINNTATGVNVRTGPGTDYSTNGKLLPGTVVEIQEIANDGKWCRTKHGWISMDYVALK